MGALAELHEQLDELCAVAMPGGSCRIAVWGPKGGSTKTTTTAAILHELNGRLVGMLAGVDANPDLRNLTERLGLPAARVPERLVTLARDTSVIRYLADWARYLDRVGRIHLLHNDNVPGRDIEPLTQTQWSAVYDLLARYAEVQVIDLGQSIHHPAARAAFTAADHLVVALPADAAVLRLAAATFDELADAGHGGLLARATVVLTATQPRVKPAVYRPAQDFLTGRVGHVQLVPYDRRAGAAEPATRFDKLSAATRMAYADLTRHALTSIRENAAEVIPPESPAPDARQHSEQAGRVPEWSAPPRPPSQQDAPEPATDIVGSAPSAPPASPLPEWASRARVNGAQ